MSSIEKLLIRGIRSFSPDSQNVIEFYSPVTIIVGHNGAGKTTIIECLKYATTGDLPPNAKGGAFVHDPKLAADSEVKAQIRLKFRNVRGQTMVVTRSMQSSQKKNKLEQKSLEGLLVTTDPGTGEQVSISTRCAELDAEIPQHLGVSRAVLENVIFCHQEESFWPLSEPSVLKRKFDEIFAATRYTKALEAIKALRKDLASELRLEQQKLDALKADQEKALRVEASLGATEMQIEELRAQVSSLDLQIASANAGIARLAEDMQTLASLLSEYERLQHDLGATVQARKDLASTMHVMTESDEGLRAILEQHQQRVRGTEQSIAALEKQKEEVVVQIETLTREYSAHCMRQGALEAECTAYSRKIEERKELLLKMASSFNLVVADYTFVSLESREAAARLMAEIDGKLAGQRDRFAALRADNAAQDDTRQQQIQTAVGRHTLLEETRRLKRRLIEDAKTALTQTEDEIAAISSANSTEALAECRRQLEEEESALSQVVAVFSRAEFEKRLDELGQRRRQTEGEMDRLQTQFQRLNQLAELRARTDLKSGERVRREEAFNKQWTELRKDLSAVLSAVSSDANVEDVERELEGWQRTRTGALRQAQERSEQTQRQLAALSSRLEHGRAMETRKEADLREKTDRLDDACRGQSFSTLIAETEEALAAVVSNTTLAQSASATFDAFLGQLGRRHECPLCDRGFDSPDAERILTEKLRDLAQERPEWRARRSELEVTLAELQTLRPLQVDADRLRLQELPELRDEVKAMEAELGRLESEVDDAREQLAGAHAEEKRAMNLRRRFDEASRLARELRAVQADCERLNREVALAGGAGDAESLQGALAAQQTTARTVSKEIEEAQQELRRRESELQLREGRVRDCREELMKRQLQQADLSRLQAQQSDANESIRRLGAEVARASEELEGVTQSLTRLRAARDTWLAGIEERESVARAALEEAQTNVGRLRSLDAEIAGGNPRAELETIVRDVSTCETAIAKCQDALREMQDAMGGQAHRAAEAQLVERAVQDNLRHRELGLRAEQLEARCAALQTQLGGTDRGSLHAQQTRAQLRQSDLMGARSGLLGELRQLEEQAGRLRSELSGEYAGVGVACDGQRVRVRAVSLGADDLDKYARALDQAIMRYHSLKMAEVNAGIRELWQATYQGADIDTVAIRADHEGAVGARSYNYRVVMVRGGVELDMRGRSSAGQRVLASLVVRLALAETFALHCGVLALDEPTTNLDRDNIAGLAGALASIIRVRRAQANFQLLVITHDEEFVRLLGQHECAEHYWRVFKDEGQHSCIERQSITGILS